MTYLCYAAVLPDGSLMAVKTLDQILLAVMFCVLCGVSELSKAEKCSSVVVPLFVMYEALGLIPNIVHTHTPKKVNFGLKM